MDFLTNFLESTKFKINSDRDFKKLNSDKRMKDLVEKEIRDLKIKFHRPDGSKRAYRMLKFVGPPKNQFITLDDGKKQSVFDYFKQNFPTHSWKHPDLPLIHCGDPKRTIYLPMELLELQRQVYFVFLKLSKYCLISRIFCRFALNQKYLGMSQPKI